MNKGISLQKALKSEPKNTNNGWGFGGYIGKLYTFPNGLFIKQGRLCWRHHPSTPFTAYFYSKDESEYEMTEISEEKFMELYSKLP